MENKDDFHSEEENLYKEEFSHVEELLISSREECIDIGLKYKELSEKVENILKHDEYIHPEESFTTELSWNQNNFHHEIEEQLSRYHNRIATYQDFQTQQAKIVDDLNNRIEEYQLRCSKLEAALAEYSVCEINYMPQNISIQNELALDLNAALIRLEQEQNRCRSLHEINNLLREQLETATSVNQTLTTDVHHLTQEWQHSRAQLLAKESEWKEEEQNFNLFFTKKTAILLALWRQILSFRHDFMKLKNSIEKDLSSFKLCFIQTKQNVQEFYLQITDMNNLKNVDLNFNVEDIHFGKTLLFVNNENDNEKARFSERILDLMNSNEKIQKLLDEKEKTNSSLFNAIKSLNMNLNNNINKNLSELQSHHLKRILIEYMNAINEIYLFFKEDFNNEIVYNSISSSQIASFLQDSNDVTFLEENLKSFHSFIKILNSAWQKCQKQISELNVNLTNLQQQNNLQQKKIEFLYEDKKKIHELNSQLTSQLCSLQEKMEHYLVESKENDDNHQTKLSSQNLARLLNDQIESLNAERYRLIKIQEELQIKLKESNEEKIQHYTLKENLTLEFNKSSQKITMLENHLESLRNEYQESQKLLCQTTLSKEILEKEKLKFCDILVNFEKQCFDLKNCMEQLRDEENNVKESLIHLQELCDNQAHEKSEILGALNDAHEEIKNLKNKYSELKIEFNKERHDLKNEIINIEAKYQEINVIKENLEEELQQSESRQYEIEEERTQLSLTNNDLTNQVTKCQAQKKTLEKELDALREALKFHVTHDEQTSRENNKLRKNEAEFGLKLEASEGDLETWRNRSKALILEKDHLEKELFDLQKCIKENEKLQDQLREQEQSHEKQILKIAQEKDILLQKMQEIENEFLIELKNERHQYNANIEILTQEKESLRTRLVASIDDLFEKHQKEKEDLIVYHQDEIIKYKKQITFMEEDFNEKVKSLQQENEKLEMEYKSRLSDLEQKYEHLQKFTEHIKKDEMDTLLLEHRKIITDMENQMKNLKNQKECFLDDISQLQSKLTSSEYEKELLAKELETMNTDLKNEKNSALSTNAQLDDLITQLKDEKSKNETIYSSLNDYKERLKHTQIENAEYKRQIDEAEKRAKASENTASKERIQSIELKDALREIEKSRQDIKRELYNLKRKVSCLEQDLEAKDKELKELTILNGQSEEREAKLRQEIVMLKQKIMESNASSEAASKEMVNSKRKLSDLEHKLKLQKEQHCSILQECLTNEQSIAEYRFNLEKSMAEATLEIQNLHAKLNFEEGKVLGLESKILKIEGDKQNAEDKLYNLSLFLRSTLGLGLDSGFLTCASKLSNSSSFAKSSPIKMNDTIISPIKEKSFLHLNRVKSESSIHFSVSDLDIDLLRSSLQDFIYRFHIIEKEKDDFKNEVSKYQGQEEIIKEENRKYQTKIIKLEKLIEDKQKTENELYSKMTSMYHYKEMVCILEQDKIKLIERVNNLENNLSNSERERHCLSRKILDLEKSEKEKNHLLLKINSLQDDLHLQEKEKEQILKNSEKHIHSMQQTIDLLSSCIQKHSETENELKRQINELLSQNIYANQNLTEELEKERKAHALCRIEMTKFKELFENSETTTKNLKSKNDMLENQLIEFKNKLKEAMNQSSQFNQQKEILEKQIFELQTSVKEYKEIISKKDEQYLMLERERNSLHLLLEKQRNCNQDKNSLERTLSKMDSENKILQHKVQNLQAQLSELEERHSQRLKDYLKTQALESKLEDDRLRNTLKQTQELLETREKIHHQKILGLEEQISVLRCRLEHESKQKHNLHTILGDSLLNASRNPPSSLIPETERLRQTSTPKFSPKSK